jgi:hypothetical protein
LGSKARKKGMETLPLRLSDPQKTQVEMIQTMLTMTTMRIMTTRSPK